MMLEVPWIQRDTNAVLIELIARTISLLHVREQINPNPKLGDGRWSIGTLLLLCLSKSMP